MLSCPLCHAPLTAAEQGVVCPAGHRFDRARQGYLNLLPVQQKKSRDPGDNAAMVEARRRFLDSGHYAPLASRLASLATRDTPHTWIDLGCGEGYYTSAIARQLSGSEGYALDISREAVRRACRRATELTWLVASMARVPLASDSCDLIASVFSPIDWTEAARILTPRGRVLRMGPTRDHLLELRQRLYDEVRPYDDTKHLGALPHGLRHQGEETLSFTLPLTSRESRADLLSMTPHGWRASAARREQVLAEPFDVTVAVRYDWIGKS